MSEHWVGRGYARAAAGHTRTTAGPFPVFALCGAVINGVAHPTDGVLDPAFGDNGLARAGVSDLDFGVTPGTLVVQADGKIVACNRRTTNGATGSDFLVVRFNRDGSLDTSFSFDGRAVIDFDAGTDYDGCSAVAVQDDGKVVVAGSTSTGFPEGQFAIARLNTDGTLDTGFGAGSGKVRVSFQYASSASAMAIQPDGRIVVVGADIDRSSNHFTDVAVARLLPDGTLDAAFNLSGKLKFSWAVPGLTIDNACCVAVDKAGNILVAGAATDVAGTTQRIAAARLLSDGSLDADFDADGRATVDFNFGAGIANAYAAAFALQRDGRIVVVGYADTSATSTPNDDIVAARLLPDGSLDASFGSAGRTRVAFDLGGPDLDLAAGIVEQANGRLVLSGIAQGANSNLLGAVVRLKNDGSLDDQFGAFGKQTYDFHLTSPFVQAFGPIALKDNQIIVGGIVHVPDGSNTYDLIAARLQNDLLFASGFE